MQLTRDSFEVSPFVIEPDDIRNLLKFLDTDFPNEYYTIDCSDQLTRSVSLDELVSYENSKAKQIMELKISSGYQSPNTAHIRITKGGNFFITLGGDYDAVSRANEFLNEWTEGVRPWYWRAVRVLKFGTAPGWLLPPLAIGVVLSIIGEYFRRYKVIDDLKGVDYWLPYTFLLLTVSGFEVYFNNKVFPSGEFAIGQGSKRYRRKETFRQVVLGGILVTILGAVLLALYERIQA